MAWLDQLLLVVERDFVGALRRGEHGDDDADDGDGNDHADRHDQAERGPGPTATAYFPRRYANCAEGNTLPSFG